VSQGTAVASKALLLAQVRQLPDNALLQPLSLVGLEVDGAIVLVHKDQQPICQAGGNAPDLTPCESGLGSLPASLPEIPYLDEKSDRLAPVQGTEKLGRGGLT
jgi:hypothetical protein